jgi:hypothetical protein
VSFRTPSVGGSIEQARTAALRALTLDDGLAEGHASLAFIKFRFDWDWEAAEAASGAAAIACAEMTHDLTASTCARFQQQFQRTPHRHRTGDSRGPHRK